MFTYVRIRRGRWLALVLCILGVATIGQAQIPLRGPPLNTRPANQNIQYTDPTTGFMVNAIVPGTPRPSLMPGKGNITPLNNGSLGDFPVSLSNGFVFAFPPEQSAITGIGGGGLGGGAIGGIGGGIGGISGGIGGIGGGIGGISGGIGGIGGGIGGLGGGVGALGGGFGLAGVGGGIGGFGGGIGGIGGGIGGFGGAFGLRSFVGSPGPGYNGFGGTFSGFGGAAGFGGGY